MILTVVWWEDFCYNWSLYCTICASQTMMSIQPCDVLMTVDQGMTQVCVMVPRSEKKLEHRYESQDTGINHWSSITRTNNNVEQCSMLSSPTMTVLLSSQISTYPWQHSPVKTINLTRGTSRYQHKSCGFNDKQNSANALVHDLLGIICKGWKSDMKIVWFYFCFRFELKENTNITICIKMS